MTGATTGLALRLDGVPREELRYLSLLPELLTPVGVIENGRPVPYEEMSERLRREILAHADFSTNPRTGRVELVLRGRASGWRNRARHRLDGARAAHAPTGAPRTCRASATWSTSSSPPCATPCSAAEESWVNDPAIA